MRAQISIPLLLVICALLGLSIFAFGSASTFTQKLEAVLPAIIVLVIVILYFRYSEYILRGSLSTKLLGIGLLFLLIYFLMSSGLLDVLKGKAMIVGSDGVAYVYPSSIVPASIWSAKLSGNHYIVQGCAITALKVRYEDKYTLGQGYDLVATYYIPKATPLVAEMYINFTTYYNEQPYYSCYTLVIFLPFMGTVTYKGNCNITIHSASIVSVKYNIYKVVYTVILPAIKTKPIAACKLLGPAKIIGNTAVLYLSCPVASYTFKIGGQNIQYEYVSVGYRYMTLKLLIPKDLALTYPEIDVYVNGKYSYSIFYNTINENKPAPTYTNTARQLKQKIHQLANLQKKLQTLEQQNATATQEIEQLKEKIKQLEQQIAILQDKLREENAPTTYQLFQFFKYHMLECLAAIVLVSIVLYDMLHRKKVVAK